MCIVYYVYVIISFKLHNEINKYVNLLIKQIIYNILKIFKLNIYYKI